MTSSMTDQRAEVCALLERMTAAWAANDADAFAALYTADASVVLPGGFHKGRDAIREFMAAGFAGPMKGSSSIDEQQDIRFVDDDVAIVVSYSGIRMAGEAEVPAERLRRATWVLTRADGKWLAAAYHNCPA